MRLIDYCKYTINNSLQDMNWPLPEPSAQEIINEVKE